MSFEKVFDNKKVTIVTPTYERHYARFCDFIQSINKYCTDKNKLEIIAVIEEKNRAIFTDFITKLPEINISIISTEIILDQFGVYEEPDAALKRLGKFTFQSLKKMGGLLAAKTKWSIVLDSETLFIKHFNVIDLVKDYESGLYVFYTNTIERGSEWNNGLVENVTKQCSSLLGFDGRSRSYMELIIWFYENKKLHDLLKFIKNKLQSFLNIASPEKPIFENVLYYMYLERIDNNEYKFVNINEEWKRLVPEEVSGRYDLKLAPMSFVGADHLSYTLRSSDIAKITEFMETYKIPFFRAEPFLINPDQFVELSKIPHLKAFVSSAHIPWIRKRIAVCVSGEFRNPPATFPKIRHLIGFLMGCDCDVYIHGWRNPDEAVILDTIKPKNYIFEEFPKEKIAALEQEIVYKELNLKPGRDIASLAMFYGMERVFELVERSNVDYDFVIRMRPDIYSESTLLEILRSISMEGDVNGHSIFVPRHFHSQGINDQLAIGGIQAMRSYMKTFSYAESNISSLYFNPESVVLKNILSNDIDIVPFDCRYALMRGDSYNVEHISHIFAMQDRTWWSSCDSVPTYEIANDFFNEKLRCVDFLKKRKDNISDIFVSYPVFPGESSNTVLSIKWRDSNPNGDMQILISGIENGGLIVYPVAQFVTIQDRNVVPADRFHRYVFCYIQDNNFIISEWKYENNKFRSKKLSVEKSRIRASYIR